jgi:hypothetical protein
MRRRRVGEKFIHESISVLWRAMKPMSSFDPAQPSQLHDAVSDQMLTWPGGWVHMWSEYAFFDASDGSVFYLGLILDGWEQVTTQVSSEAE